MKNPIRFQSRLLLRRSYKPARGGSRTLGVTFRPSPRFVVKLAECPPMNADAVAADAADDTVAKSV